MTTDTALTKEAMVQMMDRHLLWAVHYAHRLHAPDAAPRALRRELNRILRGWSR